MHIDLFLHIDHVETCVLLSREKVDDYVEIDLDVEKLKGKSGTASHEEIKAYVLEKYGFKVSTLYIAQMKDNAGLAKRDAHWLKPAKNTVPFYPPEKEEAIMDAFRFLI